MHFRRFTLDSPPSVAISILIRQPYETSFCNVTVLGEWRRHSLSSNLSLSLKNCSLTVCQLLCLVNKNKNKMVITSIQKWGRQFLAYWDYWKICYWNPTFCIEEIPTSQKTPGLRANQCIRRMNLLQRLHYILRILSSVLKVLAIKRSKLRVLSVMFVH